MAILSLNEIRARATEFAREFRDASRENADAQSFWTEFFAVFGVKARRVGSFERPAKNLFTASGGGRIDFLWKGVVLVEHKSRGEDLDRAATQARDYFTGLKDHELPRFVLVSDFARIRLYDLEQGTEEEFALRDLPRHIGRFGFISGYTTRRALPSNPVDGEAAEALGKLHDLLEDDGFTGRALDVWMVRVLFCLFADSAGIFEPGIFRDLIERRTAEDGNDLGGWMTRLHRVLATAEPRRQKSLDESLAAFPYVNGRLFDDVVEEPATNAAMREALLDACRVDWSRVSPAIFGSLFQSIKDRKERRKGGEHYTTEENILKCLEPLFLDGLRAQLAAAGSHPDKLDALLARLRRIRLFDPACGCGNFLVVGYRELRRIELEVLRRRYGADAPGEVVALIQSNVNVDQMFGIEVEDWPAQIAQVALWMTDHQMNRALSEEFGTLRLRLPLTTAPRILIGNALREDWAAWCAPGADVYCVGNPPFIGHQYRSAAQQADMHLVWGREGKVNRLDYVTCWHLKATQWMKAGDRAESCFVSTNSICQGEQVGTLWGALLQRGVRIRFAHRTFQWTSEARGKAAVHCVIIGFSLREPGECFIFDYATPRSEAVRIVAKRVNPYLVDAADVLLPSRTKAPPGLPQLKKGSQPTDGGHLILTNTERAELVFLEPGARAWLRRYGGGEELLNGGWRWCLWLKDISPTQLKALKLVQKRVAAVGAARLASPTAEVREAADTPSLFTQDRQPSRRYLAIPEVSSETRRFIPMRFLPPSVVASNKIQMVVDASPYHFGILSSTMHMAWVRAVSGRLKSDISYAPSVYNNFPWPQPTPAQTEQIRLAGFGIMKARTAHRGTSLADLYNPVAMPPNLVAAHRKLDQAVDAAYGAPRGGWATEAQRLAFLFARYEAAASGGQTELALPEGEAKPKPKRKRAQPKLLPTNGGPGDESPGG